MTLPPTAGMGRGAGSDGSGVRRAVPLWAQPLSDHQQRSEEGGESRVHHDKCCEGRHGGGGSGVAASTGHQLHTGTTGGAGGTTGGAGGGTVPNLTKPMRLPCIGHCILLVAELFCSGAAGRLGGWEAGGLGGWEAGRMGGWEVVFAIALLSEGSVYDQCVCVGGGNLSIQNLMCHVRGLCCGDIHTPGMWPSSTDPNGNTLFLSPPPHFPLQLPPPTQLVWWNVSAIGCGSFQCPRLSLAGGGRRDAVQFLVCYYLTVFIAGQPPFSPGEQCSGCPDGHPFCDMNGLCGRWRGSHALALDTFVCI